MSTKHPRLQITLDEQTNKLLILLAEKKSQSLSLTAAELIKQSLELQEDLYLSNIAGIRDQDGTQWLDHDDAWK